MKRTSVLLSVLLALAAFSHADTINLTSGSGKIYPFLVLPGYTFHFAGSGYDISIPGAQDEYGGWLVNCRPCDPFTLVTFPLFQASGDFLTSGNPHLSGAINFYPVSFVSSLAPSGILTIRYTARLVQVLFLVDSLTDTQIGPFVWANPNQPLWNVTAQYAPDGFPGIYRFAGATLTSVPEPATIMLLGTGILPILVGVRRRCKSSMLKTVSPSELS